jgi:hypothetical protein
MLLESIDEWKIEMRNVLLLNINNSIEIIMDNTFRVGISPNSNSTSFVFTSLYIGFIEKIVKGCLD